MILIEALSEIFRYDQHSGKLFRVKGGEEAGFDNGNGYRRVGVGRKQYYSHQIIWAINTGFWPDGEIDHIDGDGGNNRLNNLRLTDRFGNNKNTGKRAHSKQPHKGIRKTKNGRWSARITSDCVYFHLGTFDTPEQALSAYEAASTIKHGEFARIA